MPSLCSVEEKVQCWTGYNLLTSGHSRSLSQKAAVIDLTRYMSLLGTKQAPITFNAITVLFKMCVATSRKQHSYVLLLWLNTEPITTHAVKVLPDQ